MKTISRISISTIASLHGGLFRFLLSVNSNFSKKGRRMLFVRGNGCTWGPLQHVLMGGLHFQTGRREGRRGGWTYVHGFSSSHSLNMWVSPREAQHNGGNEKPLIIPICSQRYVRPRTGFSSRAWPGAAAAAAASAGARQLAGQQQPGDAQWRR